MASRPSKNSSRLRHFESSAQASATLSGSRVFQPSWAALTFCLAVPSSNGGTGGLVCCFIPLSSSAVSPDSSINRSALPGRLLRGAGRAVYEVDAGDHEGGADE